MFQICQLHAVSILAGARFVISMVSVAQIVAVIGITCFTGEDLLKLAWQGFCRGRCVHTRSIYQLMPSMHLPYNLLPAARLQTEYDLLTVSSVSLFIES